MQTSAESTPAETAGTGGSRTGGSQAGPEGPPSPDAWPTRAGETKFEQTTRQPTVALLGNPNTGKTTLFNRLCGLRAKTANFPGTTTDARVGRARLGRGQGRRGDPTADNLSIEVLDLPGTYGLHIELPEARVCHGALSGAAPYRRPDAAIVVVDATNLERNLRLVGELLGYGLPTVVALNMVDIARRRGLSLDSEGLATLLGCPVVPIVARSGQGIDQLCQAIESVVTSPAPAADARLANQTVPPSDRRALAAWAQEAALAGVDAPDALGDGSDSLTERLDQAFTHPALGILAFLAIMGGLFWTVFSLASVPMDLIEATFGVLGGWLSGLLPAGAVRDLLVEGVVGGIAGTVVFLPQICLLFFLISLLEDTGYLARAAFVMDRILCRFGLPGHAFVPMLSSHACALPGIMSTRLIPDRQDRLATILVAPFMSCSARLPVYVLLTGMLFRDRPFIAGLAFAGCYLLGGSVALLSAFLLRRTLLPGQSRPMVLELPTYKLPSLRTAVFSAAQQGRTFLEKAGTVIVAICIVMWWLSAYPEVEPPLQAEEMRTEASLTADLVLRQELEQRADYLQAKYAQGQSFAGRLGRAVQPAFAPLGYDWQLTVGVLTSFLAREVFVSTMAVLLVGSDEAEDDGVIAQVRDARRDDGSPVFNRATAASLLVFFVLAMQCLPTLAVTRREAGGWRWAGLQLVYMSGLAWIFAFFTYHGALLAGWT